MNSYEAPPKRQEHTTVRLRSLGYLRENTSPRGDTESEAKFFSNIELSGLFDSPGERLPMTPQIYSAVSAGKEWEKVKIYGKPMACLRSEQEDSILHLAAVWGHRELVRKIVSECPSLLLKPDSREQLPLHVAVRAGHQDVVEDIVDTLTFFSSNISEENKDRVNLYVMNDKNGDTPLHLALKGNRGKIASCLVKENGHASFLANGNKESPLYLAIEAGNVELVKEMSLLFSLDLLEGRKDLVHAALKTRKKGMLDVILEVFSNLAEERDEEGMTCLSFGASIGYYYGVCTLLHKFPESVFVCNEDGSFPIHHATERIYSGVFNEILKKSPDSKYLVNGQGQNIFHIVAKSRNHTSFLFLRNNRKDPLMEKQDVDGNTPMHLAVENWRPRTLLYLLLSDRRTCLHKQNNKDLTPLGVAEENMSPNYIFIERITLTILLYFHAITTTLLVRTITRPSDPPAGKKNKDYLNTLLVVAALVATVTFAAGFTLPGGFNSSGLNMGKATLANEPMLFYFMVFDILAMESSIFTIATLIWAQLGDPAFVHKSLNVALLSLVFALLCLPAAFFFGVYVTFTHLESLVIFLSVTFSIFYFLMLFVLAPHVILQIPGVPAFCGYYFLLLVLFLNEDAYRHTSAKKTSDEIRTEKYRSTWGECFCYSVTKLFDLVRVVFVFQFLPLFWLDFYFSLYTSSFFKKIKPFIRQCKCL